MKDKLYSFWKICKTYWYLPLGVIFGMMILINPFESKGSTETVRVFNTHGYTEELEARVEQMLLNVKGAGECRVTISLASGIKTEYVREEGAVLVVKDKEGNQVPVVYGEQLPEIAGVTVATVEAGNIRVRSEIIQAVSTLLNVGSNKICVVMREGN